MKANQNKSCSNSNPHAWIVSEGDRGRKSIKSGGIVYLKDGHNFEIELFNPLTNSVLADIKVNGNSVSEGGLIIRPGERFYLDCFIDNKKKFLFKTYEVEDTPESKSAILKNGLVEVFFYKEETLIMKDWFKKHQIVIEKHYYPYKYYPYVYYPWNTNPLTLTTSPFNGSYVTNTVGYSGGDITLNSNIMNSVNYSSCCTSNTSNIETGRIEGGDKSKQEFISLEMEFEKNYISSVIYKILPESQKPIETKDILKKSKSKKIKDLEEEIAELKRRIESMDLLYTRKY